MATLRATTASFFPEAIGTSKLATRLGAATISGTITTGGHRRIHFSCLVAESAFGPYRRPREFPMLPGHAVEIEPVSGLISKIREFFNSRAEIFGLLLHWKFEFVTQRQFRTSRWRASWREQPKYIKRPDLLADAPLRITSCS